MLKKMIALLFIVSSANAQVDFGMLDGENPGLDEGWLRLDQGVAMRNYFDFNNQTETVELEGTLLNGLSAERDIPARVSIRSGPITIKFNLDGSGVTEYIFTTIPDYRRY